MQELQRLVDKRKEREEEVEEEGGRKDEGGWEEEEDRARLAIDQVLSQLSTVRSHDNTPPSLPPSPSFPPSFLPIHSDPVPTPFDHSRIKWLIPPSIFFPLSPLVHLPISFPSIPPVFLTPLFLGGGRNGFPVHPPLPCLDRASGRREGRREGRQARREEEEEASGCVETRSEGISFLSCRGRGERERDD